MDFTTRLASDLAQAMKAGDKARTRSIRAIKAAILLAQTEGSDRDVSKEKIIQILQKLVKQRKESLEIYEEQGREDLAQKEREEIEVIESYLPAQLSDEELQAELKAIIEETGAEGRRDMGKVMGVASKKLTGRADGKRIANMVKNMLD